MANPADKSSISCEALVLSAQQGNSAAFSRLVAEMMPLVRRCAARYSDRTLDHDDLVQEGLLGLLSAVHTYKSGCGTSFEPYAGVCINNRILSALRRSAGGKSVRTAAFVPLDECVLPDSQLTLEERQDLRDECERLLHFVETDLSPSEQTVLKLFLSGLSYREIAEKLGTTPKSVDNALQRVRHKLKK